ncbi:MAG: hypothetical protein ACI3W5_15445 [Faecousia sp.]
MKKEYVKPYLALESFQLVAALAGACNNVVRLNQGIQDCVPIDDGAVAFFGAQCAEAGYVDITLDPEFCYQGPSGSASYATS